MERFDHEAFSGEKLLREGDWAVCFGADWCPFCRAFRKKFEKTEPTNGFGLAWGDVTDTDSPLWESFHLDVVPTLVVFRSGAPIWRKDGSSGRGLSDSDVVAMQEALRH